MAGGEGEEMMRYVLPPIYFILVAALILIIAWQHTPEQKIIAIEEYIDLHQSIIVSLGTIFLLSAIAIYTTILSGYISERRERNNRKISAELKVAEFRQVWINEMRNDLLEFHQTIYEGKPDTDAKKAFAIYTKIVMRLNLETISDEPLVVKEPLAKELFAHLGMSLEAWHNEEVPTDIRAKFHSSLLSASKDYLKNEWRRLKSDLKNAQGD